MGTPAERQHGGARPGAGRKKTSEGRLNIRIPLEELEAARHAADRDTGGDVTKWVREAIRRAL